MQKTKTGKTNDLPKRVNKEYTAKSNIRSTLVNKTEQTKKKEQKMSIDDIHILGCLNYGSS